MMSFKNKTLADQSAKSIKLIIADNDGTLTTGFTYYSPFGEALKAYNHRDGRRISILRQNGVKFGIITGENSEVVLRRAEKLGIDFVKLGSHNKVNDLIDIKNEYGIEYSEIAYIGDDTNDIEVAQEVGLAFAVNDAHPDLIEKCHVITSLPGGYGAVREAIDYILSIKKSTL